MQPALPALGRLPLSARSGKGSLNRSKMTASLPLKVFATDVQNGIACAASGIGFWHMACADEQPAHGPRVGAVGPVQVQDRDHAVGVQHAARNRLIAFR